MTSNEFAKKRRALREAAVAASLTVAIPVLVALVLPTQVVWPLCLVAPFIGMSLLEARLEHDGLLGA